MTEDWLTRGNENVSCDYKIILSPASSQLFWLSAIKIPKMLKKKKKKSDMIQTQHYYPVQLHQPVGEGQPIQCQLLYRITVEKKS